MSHPRCSAPNTFPVTKRGMRDAFPEWPPPLFASIAVVFLLVARHVCPGHLHYQHEDRTAL